MAIRRRGNGWQVDVTHRGRRAPRVTRPTMDAARATEAQFKADLMAGRMPTPETTGQASVRNFRGSLNLLGPLFDHTFSMHWKGSKNERQADINGRKWVETLGHSYDIRELTTQVIAEVADRWSDGGNASGTINRKLASLRKMLGVAHDAGVIPKIPVMPKRKEYAGRIRVFTPEELESMQVYFASDRMMADLIALAVETGLRQGELLALRVGDYNLSTGLLHVWKTKSDEPRSIPLTEAALRVLRPRRTNKADKELIFDEQPSQKQIGDRMIGWRHFRGIPEDTEVVFHALRHTLCSRLIEANVNLRVVQKWMGHKDINTTLRYAHLGPGAFGDALQKLEGLNT